MEPVLETEEPALPKMKHLVVPAVMRDDPDGKNAPLRKLRRDEPADEGGVDS